jgi:hypothetical protein
LPLPGVGDFAIKGGVGPCIISRQKDRRKRASACALSALSLKGKSTTISLKIINASAICLSVGLVGIGEILILSL